MSDPWPTLGIWRFEDFRQPGRHIATQTWTGQADTWGPTERNGMTKNIKEITGRDLLEQSLSEQVCRNVWVEPLMLGSHEFVRACTQASRLLVAQLI